MFQVGATGIEKGEEEEEITSVQFKWMMRSEKLGNGLHPHMSEI
jgi:hypothetical protein